MEAEECGSEKEQYSLWGIWQGFSVSSTASGKVLCFPVQSASFSEHYVPNVRLNKNDELQGHF